MAVELTTLENELSKIREDNPDLQGTPIYVKWGLKHRKGTFEAVYADARQAGDGGIWYPLCIYAVGESAMIGQHAWSHEFHVTPDGSGHLTVNPYLGDGYGQLLDVIGIQNSDPDHRYTPAYLIMDLDKAASGLSTGWPKNRIQRPSNLPPALRRNIPDSERIYCIGTRTLVDGERQSELNREKTMKVYGEDFEGICRNRHWVTLWTDLKGLQKRGRKEMEFSQIHD